MINDLTQTTCAYSWPMLIIDNISKVHNLEDYRFRLAKKKDLIPYQLFEDNELVLHVGKCALWILMCTPLNNMARMFVNLFQALTMPTNGKSQVLWMWWWSYGGSWLLGMARYFPWPWEFPTIQMNIRW